ncbi:hypothetical protein ALC60_08847, partial [Trachymyrmex zeteki]
GGRGGGSDGGGGGHRHEKIGREEPAPGADARRVLICTVIRSLDFSR